MDDNPDTGTPWDEVVDVVCVGNSPGVLAYAICCQAADLDVLRVDPPAEQDQQTAAWYSAMAEDLAASTLSPGWETTPEDRPAFSFARLVPPAEPTGRRVALEPFIGEHLRQWSARCVRSPLGVMFTQVPDLLGPMRTEDGPPVTAAFIGAFHGGGASLPAWLSHRADEVGMLEPENGSATMVFQAGRVAGVQLDDGSLVAATGGLVLPVSAAASHDPAPPDAAAGDLTVGIVGRPAGRFAMVDLVRR
jgi:hypothetical protein